MTVIRSIYARTILLLTLVVLIVFSVLGIVYYQIATQSSIQRETSLLLSSAQTLAETIAGKLNSTGEIKDPEVYGMITFAARSTGALVWVVNYAGEIVLDTGLPAEATSQLSQSNRGYYRLPVRYLAALGSGTSGKTETGSFYGLLNTEGYTWISAVYPIRTATGIYNGEIQLHCPQKPGNITSFMLTNSLVASFLTAIVIALLFIWILSRNITRPIRLLSKAAEKVARGDLSTRIVLPGINDPESLSSKKPLLTDDLTVLVTTLNTMIERLENQEHDRKDFITSLSHDLRTPITSIRGFIEGMLDGTISTDRHAHYLEIVKQESLRLQNLVNTMFDESLPENDQKYNHTVFDINQVIKEDVIGLEALLAEKKLGVQTDFLQDEQGRLMAIGDREAISRVVYNIMNNAIRFTPADGIIALTTRRSAKPREIEVTIEDSGPGIPENEYPYIFDRFYKIDKSRTSKGSGLGLFICRSILKAHGKRITVGRSDLGGARFTFTLSSP